MERRIDVQNFREKIITFNTMGKWSKHAVERDQEAGFNTRFQAKDDMYAHQET